MKTVLMSSCWLDNPIYFKRTNKWLHYYKNSSLKFDKIVLIDNASHPTHIAILQTIHPDIEIVTRNEHYGRPSFLDYKYLWVPIASYGDYFSQGYDKIIYMESDAFLYSDKAFNAINDFSYGWVTPLCPKYGFPETAIQALTNSAGYQSFMQDDPYRFNGKIEMENALKPYLTLLDLKGDRYSEYPMDVPTDADFATQVNL